MVELLIGILWRVNDSWATIGLFSALSFMRVVFSPMWWFLTQVVIPHPSGDLSSSVMILLFLSLCFLVLLFDLFLDLKFLRSSFKSTFMAKFKPSISPISSFVSQRSQALNKAISSNHSCYAMEVSVILSCNYLSKSQVSWLMAYWVWLLLLYASLSRNRSIGECMAVSSDSVSSPPLTALGYLFMLLTLVRVWVTFLRWLKQERSEELALFIVWVFWAALVVWVIYLFLYFCFCS